VAVPEAALDIGCRMANARLAEGNAIHVWNRCTTIWSKTVIYSTYISPTEPPNTSREIKRALFI